MVSLSQTFVIYVHEQSEVTWEAEDFNRGYITMFVLALVKGTMKTVQIFKNIFNVGSNRCQEKLFFLTLLFFKISLINFYLRQWFIKSDCKRESLFASWVNLNGFLYLLYSTWALVLLLSVQASRVFCDTQWCTFSFTPFIREVLSVMFPMVSVRRSKVSPGIGSLDYTTQNS